MQRRGSAAVNLPAIRDRRQTDSQPSGHESGIIRPRVALGVHRSSGLTLMAVPVDSSPAVPKVSVRPRPRGRFMHLLAVLHRWAESGWAGPAAGSWAFLQSSVVPGPADLLLIPLGVSDPPKVYRLAGWSILGATLGGLAAFALGALAFGTIMPILGLFGVGPDELVRSRALFEAHGWMFVMLSTITPLSTKLVSIAAGAFGVPLPHFLFAIFAGRAVRFLVVATLVRFAGTWLVRFLERRTGVPIEAWK